MTPDDNHPNGAWTIIIPVKDTTVAKTRLIGFSPRERAALALAFVLDSATAALSCPNVGRVLAVTNDRRAGEALSELGVLVVPDLPDAGLNAALEHGVMIARHDHAMAPVAAMFGDLPALRSEDLATAFTAAGLLAYTRWFVADADGTGTTLLAASADVRLGPSFGPHSREAHRRSGAEDLVHPGLQRLRRDVDTEAHLWEAVRLGVGRHTDAAIAQLALASGPPA